MVILSDIKNIMLKGKATKALYYKYKEKTLNCEYKKMNRKDIFKNIYQNHYWGNDGSEYYSGEGSRIQKFVNPYCELIQKYIQDNNIKTVIDLGCGDFHVANEWLKGVNVNYIGVDIYDDMIKHNIACYSNDNIRFECLDIVKDKLPQGDLCLIRQVFQHLTNNDIKQVLLNAKDFPNIIVTEHVTTKCKSDSYNIDIIAGKSIRTKMGSGVYLDENPFNLKISEMLTIPYYLEANTELNSVLIKN
ncbi:class I SAM-dependent methyltransferase [Butyrivibrio sp. M55]|uniref:class I SAM-dependent methyltransferase n=1 Tax=Butyrivibrio sp. M55 TaxID=1855323 RepID=UPI0008EE0F5B|nr:class I SAM-dependent methyltransferase [Butyrivibrio sp. M55]SFU54612.1 Methyltransferase domain-containing protein [Butyrivibrio sp. M55]